MSVAAATRTSDFRLRLLQLCAVLLLASAWLSTPAFGDEPVDEPVDEVEVQAMVEALVTRIREMHHPTRHWEPEELPEGNLAQPTGRTALAVLALLEAGEPAQSEKILQAIRWMANTPAVGTYAMAARLMVWTRLPDEYRGVAETELQRLLQNFSTEAGGWDYMPNPRVGYVDQSLTQFAMQAIADADRAGLDVPPRLVDMVRARFLSRQGSEGGWGYKDSENEPRGSMTAAGLATMALCERMRPGNERTREAVARSIDGAVRWLDEHFEPGQNPGVGDWQIYYWIHALERAGRATGLRRFRDRDWFDACAGTIRSRLFSGKAESGLRVRGEPRIDTLAFALFTVTRGLEPVPFGFFDTTSTPPAWDELGSVTSRLSDVIEKPVGWLRVGLDDPLSAWSALPIVVVRGDGAAPWLANPESPEAIRILEYAAAGGTVVAAPAGRGRFAKELQRLFTDAHPHLVVSKIESKDAIRSKPTTWRGRADQAATPVRRWLVTASRLPLGRDGDSKSTEDAATMLSAICLAETGGLLPSRASVAAPSSPAITTSFPVARHRHDGAWCPEPAVLDRLVRLGPTFGVKIDLQPATPGPVAGPGLLWVTGATATDAESLDLAVLAESAAGGRRILFESLDAEFVSALASRLSSEGWTIGPAPAGTPTGTALVRGPSGGIGLVVTSELSRPLLGRPSTSGVTTGDAVRLIGTAAALESDG